MNAIALWFFDIVYLIQTFMDQGGPVLYLIALVIGVMWMLIFERVVYFIIRFPSQAREVHHAWNERRERSSWEAHQIREAMISGVTLNAGVYIETIKTMVAICPLLGLLGTVTGMISVFDVMASAGMGNPRLMASGISKATIPTMAGMVGSLSGVFAVTWLERSVSRRVEILNDHLTIEVTPEEEAVA